MMMKYGKMAVCSATLAAVVFALPARAATVETVKVHSKAMDRDIPVAVVLPDGYAGSTNRWPVVYVLHGAGGDYAENTSGFIRKAADRFGAIMVSPDGGNTSWWLDSPVDPKMKYETFAARELVAFVDGKYRTQPVRQKRAVVGGSMGGHGACYLGFRNKEVFGAVGNVFGGVDLRPFPGNWDLNLRLGTIKEHPENWKEHSVVTQVEKVKNGELAIISVLGTSDFFLKVNRELHDKMTKLGIEHEYVEIRAESHQMSSHGYFWARGFGVAMRFVDTFFRTGRGRLE